MIKSLLFSILMLSGHDDVATVGARHNYVSENKYDNGYSESRYNEILDHIKTIYSPLIADRNGTFHIMSDWSDGAVNMWAWRWGDEYWLEIPGGMSRYYLISEEAFVLSICHELGHLLGGAPGNSPISYEGQSDYYSTLKCMRRVMLKIKPQEPFVVSEEVTQACSGLSHVGVALCERVLEGALSLSSYYAELENTSQPHLMTPSKVTVEKTLTNHPSAQCRLDTFYAGLQCDVSVDVALEFGDEIIGACIDGAVGARPRCWYKKQ